MPVRAFTQTSLAQFLCAAGDSEAEQACAQGIALARASGSRRYESLCLHALASACLQHGRRAEAKQHLEAALGLARETGLGFLGAALYGGLARAAGNAEERAQALREGEALLQQPCLSHCRLWFYRDAIDACMAAAQWDLGARYAAELEAFTGDEPPPWVASIVGRFRAAQDRRS